MDSSMSTHLTDDCCQSGAALAKDGDRPRQLHIG
jgi:hypothetical protein